MIARAQHRGCSLVTTTVGDLGEVIAGLEAAKNALEGIDGDRWADGYAERYGDPRQQLAYAIGYLKGLRAEAASQ